jgi:hypothetical protein
MSELLEPLPLQRLAWKARLLPEPGKPERDDNIRNEKRNLEESNLKPWNPSWRNLQKR